MGIYDREYYRREGPSFLGTFAIRGQVCKWLIIINALVFVVQMLTRERVQPPGFAPVWFPGPVTEWLLLNVQEVIHGQVWRLLTYAFLHDTSTIWHILFNMLFLWWFGSDLEEMHGPREFLTFYLTAAVVGGLAFFAVGMVQGGQGLCLGASGAVTAVMVLFACHFPHRTVLLFFVIPVPVWLLVGFQVVQDSFIFLSQTKTEVAVTVHLGGAAFAFLYYKFQWRLLDLWPNLKAWKRQRSRPRLRVFHGEEETPSPVPVPSPPLEDLDEQLEAKLDAVLEKVARSGQASLTDSERQILLRASEIYKRRRS
jgi:membrane associated rhomboid family serine protease